MSLVCAFDNTVHEDRDALHGHLKRFRVSREKYYHTYSPKHDPVTNELIPFKSYDQYVNADFASKITLKKWLMDNPEKGFQWAKDWLSKRKEAKDLVYAPSQVELRTLCCPSMPYFDEIGSAEGGYYQICRTLGFHDRYTAVNPIFVPLSADATIIQDTREQTPITFTLPMREEALGVGDYALAPPHDLTIRIERKSIGDFCGTLSGRKMTRKGKTRTTEWDNLTRFDKELARAVEANLYVVMMVEGSITEAQSINFLPQYKWIKASSDYLFHNLRALLVKYPLHFQAVFVDTRKHSMADKIQRVFEMGESIKTCDLQYLYERGLL